MSVKSETRNGSM